MTNMTLAIPTELHTLMKKHKNIKWSEVARDALRTQAEKLELLEKMLKNSTLTEKDTILIGKRINRAIAKRMNIK